MNDCKYEKSKIKHLNFEKGFTLIELSVVLVIIGLIVAGIVGGQALVRQAQLRDILSDNNKYAIAINAFKLEYKALPGDIRNANDYWPGCNSGATAAQCNGNGNARINRFTSESVTTPLPINDNETLRAWQHLNLAGMLPGKYSGVSDVSGTHGPETIPGENIPAGTLPKSGWKLLYVRDVWSAPAGNILAFARCGRVATDNPSGDCRLDLPNTFTLKPREASLIDQKGDDGISRTGRIIGGGGIGENECMPDPVLYNVGIDKRLCTLNFYLSL